jgi:predicted DNA-binding protein (UPF0251 family)
MAMIDIAGPGARHHANSAASLRAELPFYELEGVRLKLAARVAAAGAAAAALGVCARFFWNKSSSARS